MITIINYGLGNIRAFISLYERLNIPVLVANSADDLKGASKIILPGVGAFDYAMSKLNHSGMRDDIAKLVLDQQLPILGICVGMQMLAHASDEGKLAGLGWIDGRVRRFDTGVLDSKLVLPHMGWNTIHPDNDNPLFANISNEAQFYFLHAYYIQCKNQSDIIATTDYGIQFSSAVSDKNIYGVQFHPEKSHQWGIQLLKNFAEL